MTKTEHKNGVRHPVSLKYAAIRLRRKGATHREITVALDISLGSAHLWTTQVFLTPRQKREILLRQAEKRWTTEYREKQRQFAKEKLVLYNTIYTRVRVLKKIQSFFRAHGRIPLKCEFNMYHTCKRLFGGWNNAVVAAGFEPNPVYFAKRVKARDGHQCDSFLECVIDDWLSRRGITHTRHFRYGHTRMTADFFMSPNFVVEFFGLAGVQRQYDQLIQAKRSFCKRHGYQLIQIYPDDLLPKDRLSELLGFLLTRTDK